MNYRLRLLFGLAILLLLNSYTANSQVPFSKGVNLTNWFQSGSAKQIPFSKFTKKDFENIKSLGCDVIRLPINLHNMTSGNPDYVLDTLFLKFLDQAVDWAEELQLHLILDNHSFDPAGNTDPAVGPVLVKVWKQMATHYKTRTDYILYEVLNEPHGIDKNVWASIQQKVIDSIRTIDTQHFIVVGAADYNTYNLLQDLPIYNDSKVIYTFHFYDPFVFTHQGATWVSPSMEALSGVPFPYKASAMPAVPASLKGSWIESSLNSYSTDGTIAHVKSLIDIAVNFKNLHNVPVYCGEFGVYIPNSNNDDRVLWYKTVREYFESKNIPWTTWDYQGGFGLFKKGSNELFDYDINIPLVQVLDMNVPSQKIYKPKPQTTGFLIYDDFIGEGIVDASYPSTGTLDFYSTPKPHDGSNCIYWANGAQYTYIAFDFKPDIDLSLLNSNGHKIEFWARGTSSSSKFDVRFIDTKTGSSDHPWRMGKTVDNTITTWDGEWHKISIPLADFQEGGSYDNGWFPAEGKFDWKAVDLFEIVAEYGDMTGIDLWFDDIRDTGDDVPYEEPVTAIANGPEKQNVSISPNPLQSETAIQFMLSKPEPVMISVYTLTGQKIKTIINEDLVAGNHTVRWDGATDRGERVSSGLYLIEVRMPDQSVMKKVIKDL